jgi:hypothetical protein
LFTAELNNPKGPSYTAPPAMPIGSLMMLLV